MKTDFKKMEDSMNLLAKNMDSITSFSEQISSTLHGTRQQIAKLSSVHTLLKKLQFLFKLPGNLKDKINEENYAQVYVTLYIIILYTLPFILHISNCIYIKIYLQLSGSTRLYSCTTCIESIW